MIEIASVSNIRLTAGSPGQLELVPDCPGSFTCSTRDIIFLVPSQASSTYKYICASINPQLAAPRIEPMTFGSRALYLNHSTTRTHKTYFTQATIFILKRGASKLAFVCTKKPWRTNSAELTPHVPPGGAGQRIAQLFQMYT